MHASIPTVRHCPPTRARAHARPAVSAQRQLGCCWPGFGLRAAEAHTAGGKASSAGLPPSWQGGGRVVAAGRLRCLPTRPGPLGSRGGGGARAAHQCPSCACCAYLHRQTDSGPPPAAQLRLWACRPSGRRQVGIKGPAALLPAASQWRGHGKRRAPRRPGFFFGGGFKKNQKSLLACSPNGPWAVGGTALIPQWPATLPAAARSQRHGQAANVPMWAPRSARRRPGFGPRRPCLGGTRARLPRPLRLEQASMARARVGALRLSGCRVTEQARASRPGPPARRGDAPARWVLPAHAHGHEARRRPLRLHPSMRTRLCVPCRALDGGGGPVKQCHARPPCRAGPAPAPCVFRRAGGTGYLHKITRAACARLV